jgi:hypothetical protein
VREHCQLDETCNSLMRTVMNQMQLSARLSPGAQTGVHDCGSGGGGADWTNAFGGGAAVPAKIGMM